MWSRREFEEWKQHPLTRAFLAHLQEQRLELMEDWAAGTEALPLEQIEARTFGVIINMDYDRDVVSFYEATGEIAPDAVPSEDDNEGADEADGEEIYE